jgi:hypothetical protein
MFTCTTKSDSEQKAALALLATQLIRPGVQHVSADLFVLVSSVRLCSVRGRSYLKVNMGVTART